MINLTNIPGYTRTFNGVELTGRKRMSNHWMMNTSFAYNSTPVNFGSFPARPTRRAARPERFRSPRIRPTAQSATAASTDYLTAGSGIGNVYVNAKWLFKMSGLYQLPYDFNVSAFYNARQGYPFEQGILSPTPPERRRHRCSSCWIRSATSRLPNFQNLDFHVERPVTHRRTSGSSRRWTSST